MRFFIVDGGEEQVRERVKRAGRAAEVVTIEVFTRAEIEDAPGWRIVSGSEVFPVAPQIGDHICAGGYWATANNDHGRPAYHGCWWRVVQRAFIPSPAHFADLQGRIGLLVERVDGIFGAAIEPPPESGP